VICGQVAGVGVRLAGVGAWEQRDVYEKTPLSRGSFFNLITFLKERGFIKYCGTKIIITFVTAK